MNSTQTTSSFENFFLEHDLPHPLGLSLGIGCVVVAQVLLVIYHYIRVFHMGDDILCINNKKNIQMSRETFWVDLKTHVSNPEGFFLLGAYLTLTWMFRIMPKSYYSFEGGVNVFQVFLQLAITDFIQTLMHLAEHKVSAEIYKYSHKPHHRFIAPKFFDAFNGSAGDTTLMILIPLAITAQLVHCNVWTYMAFGSAYSGWLCLIHSEVSHPWDNLFRSIGFGSAADHHVHHALFNYNFGHLFMWWDKYLLNTYRDPKQVKYFQFDDVKKVD